jgi:hypothetical protein
MRSPAHLHRRPGPLFPLAGRLAAGLLLLAGTLGVPGLQAQQGPSLGPDGAVGASLAVRPGASVIADRFVPLLGLEGGLRLSRSWEATAEGVLALRRIRVSPDDSPDRAELTLGYGGLGLRYHPGSGSGSNGLILGTLLGAGTARVSSALVNQEVGTDNFFVIEPSAAYQWYVRGPLIASIALGYRFTPGSDPLPSLPAGEIQGTVVSAAFRLVRNP